MLKRIGAFGIAFVSMVAAIGSIGCGGHADRTLLALSALDRRDPTEAVAALNAELEIKSADDLPEMKGDNALLLLDRGTILQSMSDWKRSARDLGAADKAIDMLDLTRTAAADVGKYLFSDDSGPYKAPAYEKLMINTQNMLNYLALHDLDGAKVEARRLAIMQKYVKEHAQENGLVGLGSYLAGFAFEKAGSRDEALLYYEDALKYAHYGSLRDPLRMLTGGQKRSPGIDAVVGDAGPLSPVGEANDAEIVVVIGFGRVPQKVPVRLPIGMALSLVAHSISPADHARANVLVAKGLVTWINYPTLGPSRGTYSIPSFALDGRQQMLEEALDVEAEVRAAWKKNEDTVILAAITRMITRLVAGEVTQGAAQAAGGKDSAAGALGLLLGLATTATLAAVDTPDTRGWSTLPARIAIARNRVPAGRHEIMLGARGEVRRVTVDIAKGGWAVVPMMVLH